MSTGYAMRLLSNNQLILIIMYRVGCEISTYVHMYMQSMEKHYVCMEYAMITYSSNTTTTADVVSVFIHYK